MWAGSDLVRRLGDVAVVAVGFMYALLRKVQDIRRHGQTRRMYSKR